LDWTHPIESVGLGTVARSWLWNPESISAAINYVIEAQGELMAVFRTLTWDRLLTRAAQ
jgi:hypothetical protein